MSPICVCFFLREFFKSLHALRCRGNFTLYRRPLFRNRLCFRSRFRHVVLAQLHHQFRFRLLGRFQKTGINLNKEEKNTEL
jgi:hypothetical protein